MGREKEMCRQSANDRRPARIFPMPILGPSRLVKASWFRVAAHMVNEGEQIAFCHGMDVQENVLFSQEGDSGKL